MSASCEAWAEVRDNNNTTVDWLIAGYEDGSKTDITVLSKGDGGLTACAEALPEGQAVFGGCKLQCNGRFVSFFYAGEGTSVMARGRASMHKNGTFCGQMILNLKSIGTETCSRCF
jgi:hypothetical protein